MKVLSVVGNRPQFIKSAPLSVALRERGIAEVTLHTGQHYDPELSQVFFEELELPEPAYSLGVGGLPHQEMVAAMQPGILDAIAAERPDWVLVYGDTASTLAGARAAVEAGIPLAHVESGMRSGDWSMPEEHIRVEVDRTSTLLLCPDERSAASFARKAWRAASRSWATSWPTPRSGWRRSRASARRSSSGSASSLARTSSPPSTARRTS